MENKKYSKSMDEVVKMIQDYLEKNPDKMEYRDNDNLYFKEGYRKALQDFIYIVS
jgi:hypothetical protein